jgi:hypothetical protein
MSGSARAATENSCAAASLATGTFPASPRPAMPAAQRKTHEEASPRSRDRNRQRGRGLGKPPVTPHTAAHSVLTAADRAYREASINGDDAGTGLLYLCRAQPPNHDITCRAAVPAARGNPDRGDGSGCCFLWRVNPPCHLCVL